MRAYNCLKRASITKVGEILEKLKKGKEELLTIRNFGQKSFDELMERLEQKGYLDAIQTPPDSARLADADERGMDRRRRRSYQMPHQIAGRHLNRNSSQRKALFKGLVTQVLQHERIETTEAKAKAVRGDVEKIITLAKRGDVHARRLVLKTVADKKVVDKLFENIGPRYQGTQRRLYAHHSSWTTPRRRRRDGLA